VRKGRDGVTTNEGTGNNTDGPTRVRAARHRKKAGGRAEIKEREADEMVNEVEKKGTELWRSLPLAKRFGT